MTPPDPSPSPDDALELADFGLEREHFLEDLREGLARDQKEIPCKYLYDAEGSRIFDRICEVKDYYPTRTEMSIKDRFAGEIAERVGPRAVVVEPGSGSAEKALFLLEALDDPVAYVPVEISKSHLMQAAEEINRRFPAVEVLPVCADFTGDYELPEPDRPCRRAVVYFPGGTIGNFEPGPRLDLLKSFAAHLDDLGDEHGVLLIGFDLIKDRDTLERAYDDSEGVTAAFNLNLLERANRELDADFDLERFEHKAVWNADKARVEMHLVSETAQTVTVDGASFEFEPGETIHTENSHKFSIDGFTRLAREAGLAMEHVWTDEDDRFAVGLLGLA
jgi:dimethylhistidine N-methyltransferase